MILLCWYLLPGPQECSPFFFCHVPMAYQELRTFCYRTKRDSRQKCSEMWNNSMLLALPLTFWHYSTPKSDYDKQKFQGWRKKTRSHDPQFLSYPFVDQSSIVVSELECYCIGFCRAFASHRITRLTANSHLHTRWRFVQVTEDSVYYAGKVWHIGRATSKIVKRECWCWW